MIDRFLEFDDTSIPTITLVNMLAKIFEERVSEISNNDFLNQKASRFILFTLGINDGISQNDIVRATHLKGSTISVALARLEKEGYVKRLNDTYDQRQIRVYLTEQGEKLNRERNELISDMQKKAFKGLTIKEEKNAAFVLATMIKNLTEEE
ncbi:MAG: MarR family transcriptional regulator [Ruminococcaceae bacterium]|nr:MarR family transcriptional regulator [Oscillospiraceae bacterium]